jgi:hypothetical protein
MKELRDFQNLGVLLLEASHFVHGVDDEGFVCHSGVILPYDSTGQSTRKWGKLSLPDKVRISMRKVGEGNRDRHVEIQKMVKDAQSQLKEAQIASVSAVDKFVKILSERPKADVNNPKIGQTSSQHQFGQTAWIRKMTFV